MPSKIISGTLLKWIAVPLDEYELQMQNGVTAIVHICKIPTRGAFPRDGYEFPLSLNVTMAGVFGFPTPLHKEQYGCGSQ